MMPAYAPFTSPPSTQPPTPNLAPRDVAGLAGELVAYHARFAPLFRRPEQRRGALLYLRGQMLDLERKSIEPLARAVEGGNVQARQQFISPAPWDATALRAAHQACVGETLGDAASGVLSSDGCDVPKQGTASVGVARPWCGALGTRANGQASVVACYARDRGVRRAAAALRGAARERRPDATGVGVGHDREAAGTRGAAVPLGRLRRGLRQGSRLARPQRGG